MARRIQAFLAWFEKAAVHATIERFHMLLFVFFFYLLLLTLSQNFMSDRRGPTPLHTRPQPALSQDYDDGDGDA